MLWWSGAFQRKMKLSLCKNTSAFCNHLASSRSFQRGTLCCLMYQQHNSQLNLNSNEIFLCQRRKLGAPHAPGCGDVAVPLGWESFMSPRLAGDQDVSEGPGCCPHCWGTRAVNGNLIITHPQKYQLCLCTAAAFHPQPGNQLHTLHLS